MNHYLRGETMKLKLRAVVSYEFEVPSIDDATANNIRQDFQDKAIGQCLLGPIDAIIVE